MAILNPEVISSAPPAPAMHIPDGFLSGQVAGVGYALAAITLIWAVRRAQGKLGERTVPLMGVMAAFIFAAQMMNFPVAGGTSGHLIGGALVAILLGPWTAIIVMTSVVAVQALLFQDGGLVALGANVLNMAVISCLVGYGVYRLSERLPGQGGRWRMATAGFAAAWLSVMVAAMATSLELALSDTSPAEVVFPAMAGIHALIGIGEGLITVATLSFIRATRRDLLELRA